MKILLAVVLAFAGLSTAAPAQAEDQRHCVSQVEYQSLASGADFSNRRITRPFLELRWEAESFAAKRIPELGLGRLYRLCGYSRQEAWVGVAYEIGGGLRGVAIYRDHDATLNGKP